MFGKYTIGSGVLYFGTRSRGHSVWKQEKSDVLRETPHTHTSTHSRRILRTFVSVSTLVNMGSHRGNLSNQIRLKDTQSKLNL